MAPSSLAKKSRNPLRFRKLELQMINVALSSFENSISYRQLSPDEKGAFISGMEKIKVKKPNGGY